MNLIEKLEFILSHILELNDEPRVGPSSNANDIKEKLIHNNVQPAEDLICLYSWHDGIGYLDAFLSLYSLSEMVESIHRYETYSEIGTFKWNRNWIPILTMNADVDILINTETKEVVALDAEFDTSKLIAHNYNDYLDGLIDLFELHRFKLNHDFGGLLVDNEVWGKMLEKYNIKSAWSEYN